MSRVRDPSENSLLMPVLRLFPRRDYRRFAEVPFGCKKIDVVCVPRTDRLPRVCIELKIKNWKVAVWQATLNLQVAHESYVAVWHSYVHRVQWDLLSHYGVGLIVVHKTTAAIALPCLQRDIADAIGGLTQLCTMSDYISI